MLIMATRPIRDYNVTFLKEFCSSGSHQEITLNGLGADEIGEIILQTLQTAVNRVSPEIVRVIQVTSFKWVHAVKNITKYYTRNALAEIRFTSSKLITWYLTCSAHDIDWLYFFLSTETLPLCSRTLTTSLWLMENLFQVAVASISKICLGTLITSESLKCNTTVLIPISRNSWQ